MPIDPADVRRQAQPAVQGLVALIVDLARGEACELMGERAEALRYVGRHVFAPA